MHQAAAQRALHGAWRFPHTCVNRTGLLRDCLDRGEECDAEVMRAACAAAGPGEMALLAAIPLGPKRDTDVLHRQILKASGAEPREEAVCSYAAKLCCAVLCSIALRCRRLAQYSPPCCARRICSASPLW